MRTPRPSSSSAEQVTRGKKLAAFGLVVAVGLASPPARSAIKAVALILEVLPSPFRPLRALTRTPDIETIKLGGRLADVYEPGGFSPAPAMVLIHGAAIGGKDDQRLRDVALAFTRAGRRVVVPDLALRDQRIDIEDESRIREAVSFAAGESKAGVLAFSYGAPLCLIALAAEPKVQKEVAFVGTVGTFFDLSNLVQGVTTGTVPYHGRQIPWTPHPRAKELLPGQFALFLGGEDGAALLSAWERRDPEGLTGGARAAYELLANEDPSRVAALEAALPPHVKDLLNRLSPSEVVDQLRVPVYALHSHNDPASPPTESRLLVEAMERRVRTRHYEVSFLQHVDPTRSIFGNLREGWRIARFAAAMLREQEGWPRP